jgi:hypothetical protein
VRQVLFTSAHRNPPTSGGLGSCLCGPFEGHGSSFVLSGKRASLKSELRVANADSETVTIHGSFDQFFTLEYCELCKSFSGHLTAPLWKHAGASYIPEPQMPRYIPRPTKSRSLLAPAAASL